eukprot:314538_1
MRGKIAFLLDEYQMYNTEKSADNLKKLLDKALQRLDALHTKWALIESPIHYAVFLIDPRFRDQDILFERQEKGEEWMEVAATKLGFDWTTEIEPCYESYALSEGPFQHKSFTIKLEDDPLLCFKRLKR